jgi:hypothetical protein
VFIGESSPTKVNLHAAAGEFPNDAAKVFEVPSEAVHRVDDESVAVAHIVKRTCEFWALDVLAAGLVGKDLVQLDTIQLTGVVPGFFP